MMYTWGDMETHIQQKAIEGRMITSNTQNNNKCCDFVCGRKVPADEGIKLLSPSVSRPLSRCSASWVGF